MYEKTIEPVAIMHTGFGEKFGIPRPMASASRT